MAGVEKDQSPTWKNLMRLVDFINFVALSCVLGGLLHVYDEFLSLIPFISLPIILVIYFFLTIYDRSLWIVLAEYVFMLCVELIYVFPKKDIILHASCIFLITGIVGLSCVGLLSYWKKQFPGLVDFGIISARIQLWMIEWFIRFFINGCTILYVWLYLHDDDDGRQIVGFMLIAVQGMLSIYCCVYRLVYRWRAYHRSGAVVSSRPMQN